MAGALRRSLRAAAEAAAAGEAFGAGAAAGGLAAVCCGALAVVRNTGGPPTLPGLLVAGYGSWAAAWLLLRRV